MVEIRALAERDAVKLSPPLGSGHRHITKQKREEKRGGERREDTKNVMLQIIEEIKQEKVEEGGREGIWL